jgi:hypothetical protein
VNVDRRPEEQIGSFDHRECLAAALGVPNQSASGIALRRSSQTALDNLFHRRRLVLAEDELLQLFILLREQNVIFQQRHHVVRGAEALDLCFEIPLDPRCTTLFVTGR